MVRRKDGRWQEQLTVTLPGGRVRQQYFYGKTKSEVLRKIADWKQQEDERKANGKPFSEVADAWWEQAQDELAANTQRSYKPALTRAKAHWKDQDIRSITPAEISMFLRREIKAHSMADKTARTQLMVVNLIFRYAVQAGDVDGNPARDLEVPRNLKKDRREIASDEDIKRVKAGYNAPFGAFAYWCLYTGLRRNELLALTWADVDLENRMIHVSRSCYRDNDGKVKAKAPKTEAGVRDVPIPDKLMEKLVPGKGLVFPGESGYMTNGMFERHWRHYVEATGVTCTPHQLRHAYATMLYEAGDKVSIEDAQYLLGHANLQTTADVYTHIREAKTERIKQSMMDIDIA